MSRKLLVAEKKTGQGRKGSDIGQFGFWRFQSQPNQLEEYLDSVKFSLSPETNIYQKYWHMKYSGKIWKLFCFDSKFLRKASLLFWCFSRGIKGPGNFSVRKSSTTCCFLFNLRFVVEQKSSYETKCKICKLFQFRWEKSNDLFTRLVFLQCVDQPHVKWFIAIQMEIW